jgi:hypothetical protein
MTPQERANRALQQSGIDTWRPEIGMETLIRLLRVDIAWEIEHAILEDRRRGFDSPLGVSTEGASWAMDEAHT